jgi:hypothetical protein
MRIKSFISFYFLFSVVYICLIFFTGPFLITWGQKRSIFENAYASFIGGPFDFSKSLWLILVNSLFWFLILYLVIVGARKLIVMVQKKQ